MSDDTEQARSGRPKIEAHLRKNRHVLKVYLSERDLRRVVQKAESEGVRSKLSAWARDKLLRRDGGAG